MQKKHREPKIMNLHEASTSFWKRVKSRGSKPEIPVDSIPELNKMLWGLWKQKMYVVGARTSQGKTSFVLQLLLDAILNNKSIMYLSFEMSVDDIYERLFCSYYQIDNFDLFTGKYEQYEHQYKEFTQMIKDHVFVYSIDFGWSWGEVMEFFDNVKSYPDIIVIDYIQAISQGSQKGKEFIDDYIIRFRQYAMENNFCGILVSQLNRSNSEGRDKTPQMHHLKGSGYLEEIADVVILLEWLSKNTNAKDPNAFTIHVAKNRSGKTGYVNLDFVPEHYRFVEKKELETKENYYEPTEIEWED